MKKKPSVIAVLPARMGSSRFPGKPLAPILGLPMIEHVYRRTALCPLLQGVFVATCDKEIYKAVESFGGRAIMTSRLHQRASDRVAEAIRSLKADIVVMVQGDEPMVTPDMISQAVLPMIKDPRLNCVNLAEPITTEAEFLNPNTIKMAQDQDGYALYFSREPIPTKRLQGFARIPVYKQVCIIPFRRSFLLKFARLKPTPLETAESIDMLRALEHGYKVKLIKSPARAQSVDVPADLRRVERLMRNDPLRLRYMAAKRTR